MLIEENFNLIIAIYSIVILIISTIVLIRRNQFVKWYLALAFGLFGSVLYYFSTFDDNFRLLSNLCYFIGTFLIVIVSLTDYFEIVNETKVTLLFLITNLIGIFVFSIIISFFLLLGLFPIEEASFLQGIIILNVVLLTISSIIYLLINFSNFSVTRLFFFGSIGSAQLSALTTVLSFFGNNIFWDLSFFFLILSFTFFFVLTFIVLFEDQLIRIEKSLDETEEVLQTFIELVPVGVLFTQEGKIIHVNSTLAKISGFSLEEMKNWEQRNILSLFQGQEANKVSKLMQQTQDHIGSVDLKINEPVMFINKHGEQRWIEVFIRKTKFQMKDTNFIIIIDVTSKIRLENKFKLTFLNSPYPTVLIDGNTMEFLLFNEKFIEMFGYAPNELVKMSFDDISYPDDLKKQEQNYTKEEIRKEQFTVQTNKRYIHKNGNIIETIVSSSIIKPSENTSYYITQLVDISYLNEIEYYKRLIESTEKTNAELQSLTQMVSHDVKAPILATKNLLELIKSNDPSMFNKELLEIINQISSKIDFTLSLIKGVLDYSGIDYIDEEIIEIDLDEIITEIFSILQKPEHIRVILDLEISKIRISKTRIQQLFQNLISNSIKFCNKDNGFIKISSFLNQKGEIEFSVEDNGIGIEKEGLKNIFSLFKTSGRRPEDTGLGLAIVKKIVSYYGGSIWVESIPDQKTVFKFNLPKVTA